MKQPSDVAVLAAAAILIAVCGCSRPAAELTERPVGKPLNIPSPLGLPLLAAPDSNPVTAESVELGRALFFSPLLSADHSISCASCHDPRKSFADGQRVSMGVGGKTGTRNAPAILNASFNTLQFWDGRADSLEAQAAGPIMNPAEMASTPEGLIQSCELNDGLRNMFIAAYGPGPSGRSPVTLERITRALASYERTLLSGNSPFDRYQYGGDAAAMGKAALRGLAVFRDKAKGNCATCHTIEEKYALFTDNKFHNLGAGLSPEGELVDLGRYEVTRREEDKGAFRTPTLRNVAATAPYMHDGSLKTLREVVDFYVGGGNANPYRDKEIQPLNLTREEREDLVAFLEALTGEPPKGASPQ